MEYEIWCLTKKTVYSTWERENINTQRKFTLCVERRAIALA